MHFGSFCIFGVLYLRIFTDAASVYLVPYINRSSYCNMTLPLDQWFDGITEETLVRNEDCRPHAFVLIYLSTPSNVNFFIIHVGTDYGPNAFDFLKIQFNNSTGHKSSRCADHPTEVKPKEIVRMNCESQTTFNQNIQINSHYNRGLDIAEIELYTFATEYPKLKHTLLYRGCYAAFAENTEGKKMSFSECLEHCVREGFLFMAIQANKFCKCADMPDRNPANTGICNWNCSDNPSRYCGGMGNNYYSVYLVRAPLPYYHGCFMIDVTVQDYKLGSDDGKDSSQTHIKCISICSRNRFAILKDGNACYCRDARPHEGLRKGPWLCNLRCTGDADAFCGGTDYISIFSTCSQGQNSIVPCSAIFSCNGTLSELGECNRCNEGYMGIYCLEFADFSEVKFEPTIDMLETTTLSTRKGGWSLWKLLLLLATAASVGYPLYIMWKKRIEGESGGLSAASAKIPAAPTAPAD